MARAVDDIKQRLSIVDVIGSYIKLEKAGANFKARCPFHNEKTPSFLVSPDRGSYYCFGCNAKGDIFSFVEAFEGVDFKMALGMLAEKAGVDLREYAGPRSQSDASSRDATDRLYDALEAVTIFYQAELEKNPEAKKYLEGRGLTAETIKTWRVGFAPAEWRSAKSHLEALGFTVKEINDAGLIKQSEKNAAATDGSDYYDRFRSRIMFPLFNTAGKVIGFSGRVFQSDDAAKYVNSPETALFKKSQFLYGLHKAKEGIRRRGYAMLVEGQMDIIMCHQAGIDNVIATSGTALTEDQVKLLKRFSPKLLIAYDADKAGIQAAERAWREAVALGLEVKIAEISDGKDPADAIKENPAAFIEKLKKSQHVVEFLLTAYSKIYTDEREFGRQVSQHIVPIIAVITDNIEQAQLVSKTSRLLGVKEEAIWDAVRKKVVDAASRQGSEITTKEAPAETAFEQLPDIYERTIALYYFLLHKDKAVAARFEDEIISKTNKDFFTSLHTTYPESDTLVHRAEYAFGPYSIEQYPVLINDSLVSLERKFVGEASSRILYELKHAERVGDTQKRDMLLKEYQDIAKRKDQLSNIKK